MLRRILLAAMFIAACPLMARAADQTVLGQQLLVKNPSTPDKRKIIVKATESATDNTLNGDPTVSGATLSIALYGTNESSELYNLPQGLDAKGKPFWKGDATKGYKYKDSAGANGPVKGVQLKIKNGVFQMKAILSAKVAPINVAPPNVGTDACAQLSIGGGGDSYSVRFADGDMKNKDGKLFSVKDPTTQASCIQCGNGFIEGAEQCDRPGTSCGGSGVCQSDCTCPCDFLDGSQCLFPFPSDYLTVADGTTDSGRRVHFALDTMPRNNQNLPMDPSDYNWNDGFSQGASILVHVPNVDLAMTGAPPITDIEQSLDSDSPIIVLNTDTMQQHLSWAEIDSNASSPASQAVIIHPAVSFQEGGHYIVAMRDMKDGGGNGIPAGTAFAQYRDNIPTGDPVKEARRPHMEEIFTTLAAAGIPRNNLYLAWDFTVASTRSTTERVLAIRDDAFARLGMAAPSFTVDTVENNVDTNIYRRVTGTYYVERYVDNTLPPTRFVLDANGIPVHQSTPQPAPFQCIIPRAALANAMATAVPARASIYGHGLLGSYTEVGSGNVRAMANEHNFVFCATNWIGMSSPDYLPTVGILQNLASFPFLTDRLQQAMVDQLFLARLMIHPSGFIADPAFQDAMGNPVIDTSDVFYDGNSQGGIFGATVMALAQDITRGVLGVPGMNYSLLLTRSSDFAQYSTVLYPAYPDEMQRPLVLALIQMLWDRSDPNGYAQHIVSNPLPGTPAKSVLLHEAFGDFQVANIGTEVEARTMGIHIHQPALAPMRHSDVNPYYGIPAVPSSPFNGSALVVWDGGTPTPPTTNTAPMSGSDPHSFPRNSVIGRQQKSDFLQTGGMFVDVCAGLPCVPVP